MHSISVCLLVRSKFIACVLSFIAVYCDFYNKEAQCSWHYEACPEQIKTCGKNNKFSGKLEGFDFFSVCIFSICFTFMPLFCFWTVMITLSKCCIFLGLFGRCLHEIFIILKGSILSGDMNCECFG